MNPMNFGGGQLPQLNSMPGLDLMRRWLLRNGQMPQIQPIDFQNPTPMPMPPMNNPFAGQGNPFGGQPAPSTALPVQHNPMDRPDLAIQPRPSNPGGYLNPALLPKELGGLAPRPAPTGPRRLPRGGGLGGATNWTPPTPQQLMARPQ